MYQKPIPRVTPKRLNVSITWVPTTPGGGERKGIYIMGDIGYVFPLDDGIRDDGEMGYFHD
jgi:hypothetical protein